MTRWYKYLIAIILDLIDLILGHVPFMNTLWDIFTFIVLLVILDNKKLAFISLSELILFGFPVLGTIDAFFPLATIIVYFDSHNKNNKFKNKFKTKK